MADISSLNIVSGVITLAYVIMAGAYWQEAGRWADKIPLLQGFESEMAIKFRNRSERIFKLCTACVVFTIILTILPIYFSNNTVVLVCKYLILIPLIGIIVFCLRYTFGRYWVDIDIKKR